VVLGKNPQPGSFCHGHDFEPDAEFGKQFESLPDLAAGDSFSPLGGKKCVCDLQRPDGGGVALGVAQKEQNASRLGIVFIRKQPAE